jgi:hypothetical protein
MFEGIVSRQGGLALARMIGAERIIPGTVAFVQLNRARNFGRKNPYANRDRNSRKKQQPGTQ